MLLIRIGTRQETIRVLDISKHAGKQDGCDEYKLICAGVSAVAVGLCNAIDIMTDGSSEIDFVSDQDDPGELNHITIRVSKDDPQLQQILMVGKIQLETIAEQYSNYIDYKITEV